jgi:sensor histidine kinase YesM
MQTLVLQSEELSTRYIITFLTIFVDALMNWMLITGINYLGRMIWLDRYVRKIAVLVYFIVGIFFAFWIIGFGHHVARLFGIELHVPVNYFYRRCLSGLILSGVVFLTNYTLTLFEEKQRIMMENERLLRENLQARFETLRQQINPHFLFNSLNTLKTMIKNDTDKAEQYLLRLSDIFRYSIHTTNAEKVCLYEELDILQAYLLMLKGRFENNLLINLNIDNNQLSMYVPPFALQIIVENCVKHNIVSKEHPLHISIFSSGNNYLTVSNTLQPKLSVESSSQVGLANIDKRYQYLSGQHIEVSRSKDTFDVVIPLISEK